MPLRLLRPNSRFGSSGQSHAVSPFESDRVVGILSASMTSWARENKQNRLKSWTCGVRVCVLDNVGDETPLWATVVSVDKDFKGFIIEWDKSGLLAWQSVDDIDCFTTADEA